MERLENTHIGAREEVQSLLKANDSTILNNGVTLAELIRRPELDYIKLSTIDPDRPEVDIDAAEQININIKYMGYIKRQTQQVKLFKKLENKKIPVDINYDEVNSLRIEAAQKLKEVRPISIGQASRISGVSPADITMLMVHLERRQ